MKHPISFRPALAATLAAGALLFAGCFQADPPPSSRTDEGSASVLPDPDFEGFSTSLVTASDRHESSKGNNLTPLLKIALAGSPNLPSVVLLDGDYVGSGGGSNPEFSVFDLYDEVDAAIPGTPEVLPTYGSHDINCTDGYEGFFSGPIRLDGYYAYGITFAQMTYATDEEMNEALAKAEEQGDTESQGDTGDKDDRPSRPPEGGSKPPEGGGSGGGTGSGGSVSGSGSGGGGTGGGGGGRPPGGRGYKGLDKDDPYGISAESGAASFLAWVGTLSDRDPIVVASHVPLHVNRGDNYGARTWFDALQTAAASHDVIFLWAHNHTMEEHLREGEKSVDRDYYLLAPGDSITLQGPKGTDAVREKVNFTYLNAGYIKLGYVTVITFTDYDRSGAYDRMHIERFSLDEEHPETAFGDTGRPNPYDAWLRFSAGPHRVYPIRND